MALTVTRDTLKKFAIRSIHGSNPDDVATERVERGIENALDLLANERRFSFQQDTYDLVTTAPYETGTCTTPTAGDKTVEFSSATLPTTIVGQFLEFNDERHWYEITERTDSDTAEIRFAYNGNIAAATASTAFKIVYPLIDLPGNFAHVRALFDVEGGNDLVEVPYDAAMGIHADRAGEGMPETFSIVAKRNDPNQWQLLLYPAPSTVRQYQLVYFRLPGWYDTSTPATSTWKRKATADTDYVDWPDKLMYVLEAAVLAMVAREIKPSDATRYMSDFYLQLNKAVNFDRKSPAPMLLSRGNGVRRGPSWTF